MWWHFSEQRWEWSGGCGVKLKDRLPSKELRERLGIDDIALVLQQNRLRWYGHVLRKEDDDWVKKCMEYEVEGPRPTGRPKRTWREVVREDCQACKINKVNAIDHCKWRKMIKDVRWSGWVWVGECFFWYQPTRVVPDHRPLNGCVCVCVLFQYCLTSIASVVKGTISNTITCVFKMQDSILSCIFRTLLKSILAQQCL